MQVSKSGEAGAALSSTSLLGLDEQTKALLTVRCCCCRIAVLLAMAACAVNLLHTVGLLLAWLASCSHQQPAHCPACLLGPQLHLQARL